MFNLLSHSLISKTTLTHFFLRKQGTMLVERPMLIAPSTKETTEKDRKTRVKIMVRKSDRKILYAEANEDFVDLLFSFLTIPLQSVLQLVGDSYMGSIVNLFNDLNTIFSITKPMTLQVYSWPQRIFSFLKIPLESVHELVTMPKNSKKVVLPPFYSCPNEVPDICSQPPPTYCLVKDSLEYEAYHLESASNKSSYWERPLKLLDPKSPEPSTTNSSGYVLKNSMFVVTDDLVVNSLSSVSSISLLKEIGISVDDVEEQVISIGEVGVSRYPCEF